MDDDRDWKEHERHLSKWLRARGWRQLWRTWWYKPLPGWGGKCVITGQELFSLNGAFEQERRSNPGIVG